MHKGDAKLVISKGDAETFVLERTCYPHILLPTIDFIIPYLTNDHYYRENIEKPLH